MKKLVLSTALLLGTLGSANAQLADGSIAPDFTVSAYQSWLSAAGMNSNGSYKLYDYLDAGYTVVLDVSATWCGPCWNHHLTGALDDLYIDHGPAGQYGVSGTTTDDVMVIWLDGDGTTADATMLDGAGSIGNWIQPNATIGQVPFPMANPITATANQINNGYDIAYFPTIYKICPNRVISEVGQLTASGFYASVAGCPAPASQPADAAMLAFNGESEICPGDYTPMVQIQNNGTSAMTSATVEVKLGAVTVSTGTFTGNLAQYGVANVTCSVIPAFTGGTLVATVTTTGDANATNGSTTKVVTINNSPAQAVSHIIKVDITTDQYASETTWELTNAAGTVVATGGPWSNLSAAGQTVRPTVNVSGLNPTECYKFTIYDSYGDGICCDYGNGAYSVKDAANNVLLSGATFTEEAGGMIKTGVLNVEELDLLGFNVFPNPATDVVNVAFEAKNSDYEIAILDLQGRVMTQSTYSNLAGTQSIAIATGDFATGTYLVKVSSNGRSQVSNIVIR
ncbi:MAG: T9SS type A sorting domain-containing protein [Bacteroidota bacterium]